VKKRHLALGLAALVVGGGFVANEIASNQFRLSRVPEGVGATRVLYAKEKSWGWGGPGDNEIGVIVYPLSGEAAQRAALEGIPYLTHLRQPRAEWNDQFDNWSETPIRGDFRWLKTNSWGEAWPKGHKPSITNYLYESGDYIDFDNAIVTQINSAIFEIGSYYAISRHGEIIIVTPKLHRIFIVYAG